MLFLGTNVGLFSETNINDYRKSYSVSGLDEKAIRKSLNQNTTCIEKGKKFDAYTAWSLSWRYQWVGSDGKFHLSRFYTKIDSTITMPNWTDRSNAKEKLVKKWDTYYEALLRHELRHRQIAVDAAKELHKQLKNLGTFASGEALSQAADEISNRMLNEARRNEKQYDADTNHGKNDGARFP